MCKIRLMGDGRWRVESHSHDGISILCLCDTREQAEYVWTLATQVLMADRRAIRATDDVVELLRYNCAHMSTDDADGEPHRIPLVEDGPV